MLCKRRGPEVSAAQPTPRKLTLELLRAKHARGEPIVMITAYDYPSAQLVEAADVDLVLVGDTAAETVLGYRSTALVSLEELLILTAAVRRGLSTPLLIGDLPFGTYEASDERAVSTAQRLVKEAGVDVVKLERAGTSVARARAIIEAGIPVMGHLGVTPQTEVALGGRRAQGRSADRALRLLEDALRLQEAGCFAVVLEAVAADVAALITAQLDVPTIGIGAGPGTSGQVLVWHDVLGLYDWRPRFALAFADLRPQVIDALRRYAHDVRIGSFPAPEHCYAIDQAELDRFVSLVEGG
jgi:3-methyl-2-oxobutanoate hydroxymethyltransferase